MASSAARQRVAPTANAPSPRTARRGNPNKIAIGTMDYTIYLIVMILTLLGVVMVFSSSYLTAGTSKLYNYDTFYFLKRDGMLAIVGFIIMNVMANFNYQHLQKFALLSYVASLVLLLVAFAYGVVSHGAARWIPVPIIGRFQPSEVSKVALTITLALILARNKDLLRKWPGFIFCSLIVLLMFGFVLLGGLSSALIISIIGFGIIFIASPHILRFLLAGSGGVAAMVGYLYWSSTSGQDFRGGRFAAWLDPFAYSDTYGYQAIQSMYAIASGGMFGLGIGQSRQKTFLPEAHNDIIFAIICEELGFIGAAIILLLFGILIWRGIRVAMNAPDTFSALVASGIVLTIASQVIINVAVVTNSIPNTGVTMPFISYGGTSLMVSMAMMGILLNISRCTKES